MNLPRPDRHARALILFLAALALVRAWFAAVTELSPDEAYYWVWSTRLDVGYFNHGPLVAWLIRSGTILFGPTELGVRFGALACSLVTAAGIFAITRRLSDAGRQALWVAVLASLTPLFSAGRCGRARRWSHSPTPPWLRPGHWRCGSGCGPSARSGWSRSSPRGPRWVWPCWPR